MGRVRAMKPLEGLVLLFVVAVFVGLLVQTSAAVASAGNSTSQIVQPIAPQQGYDGGGGTAPPPPITAPPPPITTVAEPGLAAPVAVVNAASTTTSTTQSTTVSTTSSSGSVQVRVPPAALPSGTVRVAAIADSAALVAAAPTPPGVSVIVGFQISATTSAGTAVSGNFSAPVEIDFTVPASAVPSGASVSEVALAFWNGSDWVVTDATITANPDGSLSISAAVMHFTLFSVFRQPRVPFAGGTYPPAGGFGLMVWQGLSGTSASAAVALVAAKPAALYMLDTARQRFLTYIPGAPAGVSDVFTLTKNQAVIVKAAGSAPAPSAAPAAAAPVARTVTVQVGDTLTGIGVRTGVDWRQIAEANKIAGPTYVIQPGQVLTIPAAPVRRTTTVAVGDSLIGIGARTGVDWRKIAELNGIAGPAYVVQPGQSLFLE